MVLTKILHLVQVSDCNLSGLIIFDRLYGINLTTIQIPKHIIHRQKYIQLNDS